MTTRVAMLGCLEETRDTLEQLACLKVLPTDLIGLGPAEAERQGISNFVDLEPLARRLGIAWHTVSHYGMGNQADVDLVARLNPAALLVVGWQRLVPKAVLDLLGIGAIGFHGSCNILPWGRGRSPINWSIIEGRDRFSLHMFLITPGVDDGEILGIRNYDINPWDTCRSVYYKTAMAQAELIARHMPAILAGEVSGMRQQGEAFHYAKRTPEDGRIDWAAPTDQVHRLVRAVAWPYPGAFCFLDGTRVNIWEAQPFSRDFAHQAQPGEVCFVARNGKQEFVVRTGDGTLLVTAADLAAPLQEGDILT